MTFDPRRLYYWVETLFADYRKAHPDKALTTHVFRKCAFTLAWHASIAHGCKVDTPGDRRRGREEAVWRRREGRT